jgi:hypothetical protein
MYPQQPAPMYPQQPAPMYPQQPAQPAYAQPAAPTYAQQPAQPAYAQPAAPAYAQQPAQPAYAQPTPHTSDPFAGGAPISSPTPSIPPPSGGFEAELGTNSISNFYKTLNGNDIVEHGGIFVSSYKMPTLGKEVDIRVHFPGGYQFDCRGIVRWVRESTDNADAPPGFGAQMVNIGGEQRQLIQRYVRNREPLFYDDF